MRQGVVSTTDRETKARVGTVGASMDHVPLAILALWW